mmetsp:Transcript_46174/g.148259  ORF Transcript_46174/g.148259 Transcript_46174/m.148259 type:complete len:212 (+) Transcript_46174:735-1370(+)
MKRQSWRNKRVAVTSGCSSRSSKMVPSVASDTYLPHKSCDLAPPAGGELSPQPGGKSSTSNGGRSVGVRKVASVNPKLVSTQGPVCFWTSTLKCRADKTAKVEQHPRASSSKFRTTSFQRSLKTNQRGVCLGGLGVASGGRCGGKEPGASGAAKTSDDGVDPPLSSLGAAGCNCGAGSGAGVGGGGGGACGTSGSWPTTFREKTFRNNAKR